MQNELRVSAPIVLASASPRRRDLIHLAFQNVRFCSSKREECVPASLSSEEIPVYLAESKAREVASKFPEFPVVGCDTVVILNGDVLNKPRDSEEAFSMLLSLSGKTHEVRTGCSIIQGGRTRSFCEVTHVEFHSLSAEMILKYINTGEPFDKAGAYGIQGYGSLFVKRIQGDYFNVVGLPVSRLYREFSEFLR